MCSETNAPRPALMWVWLLAWLPALGWMLSAVGQLNRVGYAVGLVVAVIITGLLWRPGFAATGWGCWSFKRLRRRFGRPLPFCFLVTVALGLVGGLLYAPNNYDALSYRTPRSLHWLAAGRWHWIETVHERLNTRASGFEWATTPLLAFTHSDRLFFLLSFGSFLLLPGLTFAWLRRMGVGGRAAWNWMWVFAGGYCFALQAGGIQNDLYGVTLVLAAMVFARRASDGGKWLDLATSVLAAALSTNAKSSNLPLLLPWAIAIWPASRACLRRPLATALVLVVAALGSLLPVAVLNQRHCGDWSGASIEPLAKQISQRAYAPAYVVHNAALLVIQNLAPPVFPFAGPWNAAVQHALPERWLALLDVAAEEGRNSYRLRELPGDEHTGLGLGVTALLLVQLALRRRQDAAAGPQPWSMRLLRWSPWLSLLVYSAIAAIQTTSRIAAPYYALLLPTLLPRGSRGDISRRAWWPRLALLAYGSTFLLMVLSPSRPLWPAVRVLGTLQERFHHPLIARALTVYQVYGDRAELLSGLVKHLDHPDDTIGFIAQNALETSLWKPFGTRRVVHLLPQDDAAAVRARGAQAIVVPVVEMEGMTGLSITEWSRRIGAELVVEEELRTTASHEPARWALFRLKPL